MIEMLRKWLLKYVPLVKRSSYEVLERRLEGVVQTLNAVDAERRDLMGELARAELSSTLIRDQADTTQSGYERRHEELEAVIAERDAQIAQRDREIHDLRQLVILDGLTGLINRTGLVELGTREINLLCHELRRGMEEQRRPSNVTAIAIDLDHFKMANDSQGHAFGDEVLRIVAKHAKDHLGRRLSDIVARPGGDELVVLMFDANQARVQEQAEAFRRALQKDVRLHLIEGEIGITASIGIGRVTIQADSVAKTVLTDVLRQADNAMYLAKAAGRNTIRLGQDVTKWGGLEG